MVQRPAMSRGRAGRYGEGVRAARHHGRVNELIAQIRQASAAGLYYLALLGALSLPDICGALSSEDGRASPAKYKDWLRGHVPTQGGQADLIYGLRCSLLHQGRAKPHGSHYPVAFTYGGTGGQLHNLTIEAANGERTDWISIPIFVEEVTSGAEQWFAQFGSTKTVCRNMDKFARLRPNGLPPSVVGGPVIA